jgi:hypothetical protein
MQRTRIIAALTAVSLFVLVTAPAALASAGQGWYGETDDKSVTNAMFLVILFFPAVVTVFTLIQWRLDKRKHARMDAKKDRAASADWRGGW